MNQISKTDARHTTAEAKTITGLFAERNHRYLEWEKFINQSGEDDPPDVENNQLMDYWKSIERQIVTMPATTIQEALIKVWLGGEKYLMFENCCSDNGMHTGFPELCRLLGFEAGNLIGAPTLQPVDDPVVALFEERNRLFIEWAARSNDPKGVEPESALLPILEATWGLEKKIIATPAQSTLGIAIKLWVAVQVHDGFEDAPSDAEAMCLSDCNANAILHDFCRLHGLEVVGATGSHDGPYAWTGSRCGRLVSTPAEHPVRLAAE